ncbi:MAG: hypothetical protein E7Z91_02415 [Cyanobacteria bacterium SIG30]|nr:hypothetical protein [Cyanobacteria bacterium SIG30]
MANLETLHERANNALIDGNNELAIKIYNEIIESSPEDTIAYSQLMDLYYDTDKMSYYITRANLNIVQGHYEHAINDCKKAINLDASEVRPHLKLAKLYAVTKKNVKAIDEFLRVLELDPTDKNVYFDLITLYGEENSKESALNIALQAVKQFENDDNFKNIAANLYYDFNDYEKALEFAKDNFIKAKIYLQMESLEKAYEVLEDIKNSNPKKDNKINYLKLLAQYNYVKKDFNKALETLGEYVKEAKPNPVYFQMMALVYEGLKDEVNAHINWGYCAKQRDRIEEAIVQFHSAHNLDPKNKDILFEIAKLYEMNNEKFVSMDFYQKIYEIDGDKEASNILADFYKKQGDLRLYKKYAGIEEDENVAKEYEEAFEQDEGLLNKILNFFSKK